MLEMILVPMGVTVNHSGLTHDVINICLVTILHSSKSHPVGSLIVVWENWGWFVGYVTWVKSHPVGNSDSLKFIQ